MLSCIWTRLTVRIFQVTNLHLTSERFLVRLSGQEKNVIGFFHEECLCDKVVFDFWGFYTTVSRKALLSPLVCTSIGPTLMTSHRWDWLPRPHLIQRTKSSPAGVPHDNPHAWTPAGLQHLTLPGVAHTVPPPHRPRYHHHRHHRQPAASAHSVAHISPNDTHYTATASEAHCHTFVFFNQIGRQVWRIL